MFVLRSKKYFNKFNYAQNFLIALVSNFQNYAKVHKFYLYYS